MRDLIPTGPAGRTLFAGIGAVMFLVAGWNMWHVVPQDTFAQFFVLIAFGLASLAIGVAVDRHPG